MTKRITMYTSDRDRAMGLMAWEHKTCEKEMQYDGQTEKALCRGNYDVMNKSYFDANKWPK